MDKYQALRELPFPVVIEALGYSLSDFKSRKGNTEWAGKCPVHRPKKNSTAFSYNQDGRFACFSCTAKGRGGIDLTMQVKNIGFQEAVSFLESISGQAIVYAAQQIPKPMIKLVQELPEENEAKAFTYEKHYLRIPPIVISPSMPS